MVRAVGGLPACEVRARAAAEAAKRESLKLYRSGDQERAACRAYVARMVGLVIKTVKWDSLEAMNNPAAQKAIEEEVDNFVLSGALD